MSGFIAIVNFDGASVDSDLLLRITRSMAWRGPDAQEIRILDGANVGFGCALLRTTFEAAHEVQPCGIDDSYWIAADCRLDAREDLMRELRSRGRDVSGDDTDPELLLHAYAAWGTGCVSHLLGDFSFAIWDAREKRLFCARDHMGVRLLYYALLGSTLIVSNSLGALRLHPAVPRTLNELAIADYLLFGANQDATTTSFSEVRRLLPAHGMTWAGGELRMDRYWELPIDPPLRLRRRSEYAEHFWDLLRLVMRDRLRTDRVGIMMSGGLDSAGMAAAACDLNRSGVSTRITAYTTVFDSLVPDRERYYAGLVAERLQIPIRFFPQDDYQLFQDLSDSHLSRIQDPAFIPGFGPDCAKDGLLAGMAADGVRVAFHGEGADNGLSYEWKAYARYALRRGQIGSLIRDAVTFPYLFGKLPYWSRVFPGKKRTNGAALAQATPSGAGSQPGFHRWIQPDFAAQLRLAERFEELREKKDDRPIHPVRPFSYSSFTALPWQFLFEMYDPEVTGLPLEVRHPYVDVRMLRYLLSVPAIPWCRDKFLLREALRTPLPAEVIQRPKQGLSGFPNFAKWSQTGLPEGLPTEPASRYVDFDALKRCKIDSPFILGDSLRPYALALFIGQCRREML